MAEAANYMPENYVSEILAEYEPDMFAELVELAEVFHEDYQDATIEELQEALFNILETMTPVEADFWLDELEAIEMEEAANYMPEVYMSEVSAEYEPDISEDSAELAEALREALREDYQDATTEEMEEALFNILETMTPAEGFNFTKALGHIWKAGQMALQDPAVGQIARTVLPAAGRTIGNIYGGPVVGRALGGSLGQVTAQVFSGGRKPSTSPARSKVAKASPKGGSAAAAQLLQLTQNPDMLKSLLALALGSHGRRSVKVGKSGPSVPVGGFMNLLSTLASKAVADADELLRESDETYAYLLDGEGDFRADPANPQERAESLYGVLVDAENERSIAEEDDYWPYTEVLDEYMETIEDTPYFEEYDVPELY